MPGSLSASTARAHREISETPCTRMAKAVLRKAETPHWRRAVGACIRRARLWMGWNLDEFAQHCPTADPVTGEQKPRDPRQVARWETGDERPHFDILLAIPAFSERLILELGAAKGAQVVTRMEFTEPARRAL